MYLSTKVKNLFFTVNYIQYSFRWLGTFIFAWLQIDKPQRQPRTEVWLSEMLNDSPTVWLCLDLHPLTSY